MNKEQFAKCPFCGKSETLTIGKASDAFSEPDDCGDPMPYMHTESYAVTCDASKPDGPGGCGASGGYFPSEDEAIAAWNRRAEVERLAAQAEPAPAPFAKDSWQHAVDNHLSALGKTSEEFPNPHEAVRWLLEFTSTLPVDAPAPVGEYPAKALEGVEPVACLVNADLGAMVWPISDIGEAGTYCDEGEFPELLYPAATVSALQARIATQAEHQAKALEGVEPIGYIAWRDGKPAWSEDCVCEDAVFPRDIEDDCTSMAIYPATTVSALQARIAELESELRRVTTSPPTGSAPCARLCEHMAFQIQAKSDARRIAELEALLQEAGRTIDNLTVYNRAIGHCITAIKEALK